MWLFSKDERKEIWDEAIQWPIGDIEAADKIRNICRSAGDSAERIGGLAGPADNKKPNNKKPDRNKDDTERYQRAAKTAMEIAMKISDDLMRDAAVREIVELCLKANDTRTARILFRAIHAVSIREAVLSEHPDLRQ
ncbi:hypothetical protein [Bradyrhizobium sp.]|jgi:hypothetical protein|uniref:hypothetical protein n=1 Tax=Bradyrhizobium sp. TaxID=376 RepID=UPI003BAE308D